MLDVMTAFNFCVAELLSGQEYLTAEITRVRYPAYHVDEETAHTQTALLCMCYISVHLRSGQKSGGFEAKKRHESFLPVSLPLLEYALHSGFEHLAYVNLRNRAILPAIKDFQSCAE